MTLPTIDFWRSTGVNARELPVSALAVLHCTSHQRPTPPSLPLRLPRHAHRAKSPVALLPRFLRLVQPHLWTYSVDVVCRLSRRKRIAELQKGKTRPKFGTLEHIRGTEFVQKVTNAGEGIWVVCLLYKDRQAHSSLLSHQPTSPRWVPCACSRPSHTPAALCLPSGGHNPHHHCPPLSSFLQCMMVPPPPPLTPPLQRPRLLHPLAVPD